MNHTHCLGFPRIGARRQMKFAVEQYWRGTIDASALAEQARIIRADMWQRQADAGLSMVTVGDFCWYDHVLEMSVLLGAIPPRFQHAGDEVSLDTQFRMARGRAPTGDDVAACEMTKWFDTNYHYIVPELYPDQAFKLSSSSLFEQVHEARSQGYTAKPVLIGPLTYLWLAKLKAGATEKLDFLGPLLEVYGTILAQFKAMDVAWVQIDEPILCLDLPTKWQQAFETAYNQLHFSKVKILLATYFDRLEANASLACELPVAGLHVDLTRGEQLSNIMDKLPDYKILSAGIIDGRNIWRANLREKIAALSPVKKRLGDRLWLASSCALLHVPVDLAQEEKLDPEIKQWLAFATQKLTEITVIRDALLHGEAHVADALKDNDNAMSTRKASLKIHDAKVKERSAQVTADDFQRDNPYDVRAKIQAKILKLPAFPTTTIGSFPQTQAIRNCRKTFKEGACTQEMYDAEMRKLIIDTIHHQESVGIDVLVHGEPERNDMVEYFGEQLQGFAFTTYGWVQSYGSRCVKPPIIYGDVSRIQPMTVAWSQFAQSQTSRWMKGMLTGPVTLLCWSFVRDDQPRQKTCQQIALALRDEVNDLVAAGIHIIQMDEPAFREGLPLRKQDWRAYLDWAVNAFKLSTCGVSDETQIHTHMCYAEFNDIIEAIAALDADVITMEASRSQKDLFASFKSFEYPNAIGPGVYDIHSPVVPTVEAMVDILETTSEYIPADRIWVNPDCGLKTRDWPEVEAALSNMVAAAKQMR